MKLNDEVIIENFGKPYFIAEFNTSHFGSLDVAKQMIDAAKNSGCDCVKFQSWSMDTLYSDTYYRKNPVAKRFINKFSFSSEQLKLLADYAHALGISFSSTPYSVLEVDFLIHQCKVPFIKIASMEINNFPYLDYIARTGSAILLSTGMADQNEINRAVKCVLDAGNRNLCLLHCVSIYPAQHHEVNLNNLITFRDQFDGIPVGYSDHTLGLEVPIAAVAHGAPIIEKHFTLDAKKIGMDNQMAMEPVDFKAMIKSCNIAWECLGSFERTVSEAEFEQRINMRRSIVSKRDIPIGARIQLDDIDFKRPGDGFSPEEVHSVVGMVASQNILRDEVIYSSMFKQ